MLAHSDDGAGRGPTSRPTGARMEIASPLVSAHRGDGRVDVITKAALGLLPNDNVRTRALEVRSEVGPRVGVDCVEGPQPNVCVHKRPRVDAAGTNLR